MTTDPQSDLSTAIAPHLPYLRRFARALTGRQASGDAYAAATLEAIVADPAAFDLTDDGKVALFAVFHKIWASSGAPVDSPDGGEGALAASAQRNLAALTPSTRVAVLLHTLEGFDAGQVGRIMGVSKDEAAADIRAGEAEIGRQLAGRVLIIEDQPIIALDLEAIVKDLGHEVTSTATTRDAAVAAAKANPPNLILADIQLADGSSGIDAVNDILAETDAPAIFITAYPERLLTGDRPEPTFLITKPFREEQVRATIGQALFFKGAALS